jgi:predicted RNA methylase
MALSEHDVVVDIGCGTGRLLLLVVLISKAKMVLGVENFPVYLHQMRHLLDTRLSYLGPRCHVFSGDIDDPKSREKLNLATVIFSNNF